MSIDPSNNGSGTASGQANTEVTDKGKSGESRRRKTVGLPLGCEYSPGHDCQAAKGDDAKSRSKGLHCQAVFFDRGQR